MYNKINGLHYQYIAGETCTKQDAKIAQACVDFESVFLTTLWRGMAKNAGVDLGSWDVLLSQSMGKVWAQSGGIGLAKVLYDNLSKSSSTDSFGDDFNEKS